MSTRDSEKHLVVELARKVAEIAAGDENKTIVRRWRDVNALRKPDRAPVWCRPVGCWSELLPDDSLTCQTPALRNIERAFRRMLIKQDIGDDSPVEPYFAVSAVFECDPSNRWGVDIVRHKPDEQDGAWKYDPPLKEAAHYDRLRIAAWTYNEAETRRRLDFAHDLFGEILPPRLICTPGLGPATIGARAADLRGMTEMMMDCIANPDLMHRLMAFLRDSQLAEIDTLEASGLLTANNLGPMHCSDPVGEVSGGVTLKNLWCHGNSQTFDQVSPAMWEEFCLDYQKPIFERFGMAHYGCCENLTNKIDAVLRIPNLRIFTCSAWTDLNVVLDRCGADYVIMWRQKATDVVFPDDEATIKRDLNEGAERLRGSYYQIVLRELQTLAGHPDRLHVWTRLAIEAAANYA